MTPLTCPACKADLRETGMTLPEGEAYGGEAYYSRVIGIYSTERDRTTHWRCPDCNHEWERK